MANVLGDAVRRVENREHLGKPALVAIAGRTYETTVEDLWDALTTPERLVPKPAEAVEPRIDVGQRLRPDGVEAPSALTPHCREAALSEHLQMLRDGRLRDPELAAYDRDDLARRVLAVGEELQDPAADRVAQDVERMHQPPA